jgi:hypothetical protein
VWGWGNPSQKPSFSAISKLRSTCGDRGAVAIRRELFGRTMENRDNRTRAGGRHFPLRGNTGVTQGGSLGWG